MYISQQKIEMILAERGMTKKDLAFNIGMARQNVSNVIRRGPAEPKTVGKLALGLGVPVAEIIKEASQRPLQSCWSSISFISAAKPRPRR